jgi:hypothetical protein
VVAALDTDTVDDELGLVSAGELAAFIATGVDLESSPAQHEQAAAEFEQKVRAR